MPAYLTGQDNDGNSQKSHDTASSNVQDSDEAAGHPQSALRTLELNEQNWDDQEAQEELDAAELIRWRGLRPRHAEQSERA